MSRSEISQSLSSACPYMTPLVCIDSLFRHQSSFSIYAKCRPPWIVILKNNHKSIVLKVYSFFIRLQIIGTT